MTYTKMQQKCIGFIIVNDCFSAIKFSEMSYNNMRKILVFPTWVIVRLLIPFLPAKNPWHKKRFTLSNWAEHSTKINDTASANFWMSAFMIAVLIIYILLKKLL